jgi:probable F420-dependent oxidoreductase
VVLPGGKVYRARDSGQTLPALDAEGRPAILGAGPLAFRCVEPFRTWTATFNGTAAQTSTQALIAAEPPGPRVEIEFQVTAAMAVPPWIQGSLLPEAAERLKSSVEGDLMGGPRYEQLFRARGTLRVDGEKHVFSGSGLRIRRQGVRRLGGFWGHCWQSALFPSGRAFGYIAYPPRPDGEPTFNEGYLFDGDGPLIPARVVQAPWLTSLVPDGEDVSVVFETARGQTRIEGTTAMSTFDLYKRPDMPDFPVLYKAGSGTGGTASRPTGCSNAPPCTTRSSGRDRLRRLDGMTMRFIFHYPEKSGPEGDILDAGPLAEVAATAERCGFAGLSLSEHPAPGARWLASGGHQTLDPFVALSFAAAATRRLRLLTYLSVAPYRNPFILAKAAATLDKLSGGRLILGLGAGYAKSEFHALGVEMAERNALFDEVLDVLPLHWSGQPFSYQGRHFSARDVMARPRPAQDPIPVWIGGNSALSRRRAAERAQGWMPMSGGADLSTTTRTPALGSLGELSRVIAGVRGAATAAGRAEPLDVLYSYQGAGLRSPAVEPDRHREALAEIEKAGATWVVVSGGGQSASATLEFLEAFGSTYLSRRAAPSGAGITEADGIVAPERLGVDQGPGHP